jgi:hypothetical protein
MSLDGYVADLNDGVAEVFDWYASSGDVEIDVGGSDPMTFHVSQPKSTSTSRRFFSAPEFDSSTASPARQSSLATRR